MPISSFQPFNSERGRSDRQEARHGIRFTHLLSARATLACRYPRQLPDRRDRGGRSHPRDGRDPPGAARPNRRPGTHARHQCSPRTHRQRRYRCISARIWAVLAGGGRALMPRRGAAARPRCRDGRPADPRQDRRGELGRPSRALGIDLRQCLDLGIDADRAPAACRAGTARSCGRR
jgi:hypothetical protein